MEVFLPEPKLACRNEVEHTKEDVLDKRIKMNIPSERNEHDAAPTYRRPRTDSRLAHVNDILKLNCKVSH